jgi:integrase/recombinase XerC
LINTIREFNQHLKASGKAPSTISCYQRDLERLLGILGNVNLGEISTKLLEEIIVMLQDSSVIGKSCRAAATMNRIKSAYRSFFTWAYESGHASHNPALKLKLAKAFSQPTTPIQIREINQLLATISKSNNPHAARDEALFALYAFTGIRCSEAVALRIKDYNSHSLLLNLPDIKSARYRLQPLPDRLCRILEKWIYILNCNGNTDLCSFLFSGRHPGQPLSPRQVLMRFNYWKTVSDIRNNLTIHSFRAGFATLLYQSSGDLLLVARALGHRNIRTTIRYIGDNVLEMRKVIENVFVVWKEA